MTQAKKTLIELIVVTAVGTVISLAANGMNGKGVHLGTDYFPKGNGRGPVARPPTQPATASAPSTQSSLFEAAVQAVLAEGLQPITQAEVIAMTRDPSYESGEYVLIDDRKDEDYQLGHIPGAHQFYHYEMDRFLDDILPVCQHAIKVVTYCNGEDCDDSKFAALTLLTKGVDPGKVFVYVGGFTEWRKSDLPVERGERGSGDIVPGSQVGEAHE
jgi:rhodanese-related sulfurtransferase